MKNKKFKKEKKIEIYFNDMEYNSIIKKIPVGSTKSIFLGKLLLNFFKNKKINLNNRRWDKE